MDQNNFAQADGMFVDLSPEKSGRRSGFRAAHAHSPGRERVKNSTHAGSQQRDYAMPHGQAVDNIRALHIRAGQSWLQGPKPRMLATPRHATCSLWQEGGHAALDDRRL